MKLILCLVYLTIFFSKAVLSAKNNDLIVKTANGKLKGRDNANYYSYESIRYAEPAIGELRFEPPKPYERKWTDIKDATVKPSKCMQWNPLNPAEYKLEGVEDCLFVNIYKPKTGKQKYPVLVFIHGGAFMFGPIVEFGEDYLMQSGNLILVKISYRLGPLGFLSTEDDAIAGNFGLKDQQLALKWIKENIANFGGDPEKIMLYGFSAGAASTHLHMLQPSVKNIAKVAVSVSGTAFCPWLIQKNARKNALKLAELLQCPDLKNTKNIKKCLKQKKPEDIVKAVKEFFNIGYNPITPFGPVIEHKTVPNPFMTQHPGDILKSGNYAQIPWLASHVAQDGGYNAAELLQINPKTGKPLMDEMNDRWMEFLPQNLFLDNIKTDPQQYAMELKNQYLGKLPFSEENYFKVQKMYTDVLFKNGVNKAIKLQSLQSRSPVYGYVYDNPADFNLAQVLSQRTDIKFGTIHSDDLTLMLNYPPHVLRPDEKIISQKFIKMLEDFVETGKPTFGNCTFENNAGKSKNLKVLSITKDNCKTIIP